jgi:hypothetical protein
VRGGGGFEGAGPSSEDVDCCAAAGEGFGHRETDPCARFVNIRYEVWKFGDGPVPPPLMTATMPSTLNNVEESMLKLVCQWLLKDIG